MCGRLLPMWSLQRLLRVGEFLHQAAIAARFFDRVEVLALDVLDQRDLERVAIGEIAHHDRHFVQLRLLRRAPAPLAGDDLPLAGLGAMRAHQDRLQHALLHDGLRELAQLLLVERRARLHRARMQELDRRGARRRDRRCALRARRCFGVVAAE